MYTAVGTPSNMAPLGSWPAAAGFAWAGYTAALSSAYALTSWFLVTADAALFNLSLLTSDVYAVAFSFVLDGHLVSWMYFLAFAFTLGGLFLYHTAPSPTPSAAGEAAGLLTAAAAAPATAPATATATATATAPGGSGGQHAASRRGGGPTRPADTGKGGDFVVNALQNGSGSAFDDDDDHHHR